MENQNYLNKQVSEITGLTGRQVLSWSEKGLIVAFKESTGVGTKRFYNYLNLLEFGLCKVLFSMGIGFRAVKKMIGDLRKTDVLRNWSENFQEFYEDIAKKSSNAFCLALIKDHLIDVEDGKFQSVIEQFGKIIGTPYKPDHPTGILVYFFSEDEKPNVHIIPWEIDYAIRLDMMKEGISKGMGSIIVDIGKVKESIDRKL